MGFAESGIKLKVKPLNTLFSAWSGAASLMLVVGAYFLPKNSTINSETFEKVLEGHLLSFMHHGTTHFLRDGAPCHANKCIKKFLADKAFEVIDWPSKSPDLNPSKTVGITCRRN
jgi:hypothetical protein